MSKIESGLIKGFLKKDLNSLELNNECIYKNFEFLVNEI